MWHARFHQPIMCRWFKPGYSKYENILLKKIKNLFLYVYLSFVSWCTNYFRPSVDTHTAALSEGQHEFHIWIHFKVALLANSNVSSVQFCFISWGVGASAVELRAQKLLYLKDCLWQNRTTIYIRDNFTALCNFHCLYVEKEELFLVQFTSKRFRSTHNVIFFIFLKRMCVSVCVWLAGQPAGSCRCKEGFGGPRCDRWETHIHARTRT